MIPTPKGERAGRQRDGGRRVKAGDLGRCGARLREASAKSTCGPQQKRRTSTQDRHRPERWGVLLVEPRIQGAVPHSRGREAQVTP